MEPLNNLAKPDFTIFLDIDGVINTRQQCQLLPNNQRNLRWNKQQDEQYDRDLKWIEKIHYPNCEKSVMLTAKAQTHLFNKQAVANLEELITKMQERATVHIVLSSDWRKGHTIPQLQEIFSLCAFSQLIEDKTTVADEDSSVYSSWSDYCTVPHFNVMYTFHRELTYHNNLRCTIQELRDADFCKIRCRASQIKEYLHEHPECTNYLIFDDIDSHLSDNFADRYISTCETEVLTSTHTEKAYAIFEDLLQNPESHPIKTHRIGVKVL